MTAIDPSQRRLAKRLPQEHLLCFPEPGHDSRARTPGKRLAARQKTIQAVACQASSTKPSFELGDGRVAFSGAYRDHKPQCWRVNGKHGETPITCRLHVTIARNN
jgi:hypothetical protein